MAALADAAAPSPAVAPPPGNPRFPLFDAVRGLAVLAVLTYHVCLLTGALDRRWTGDAALLLGYLGPIVFFALSAFLLYRPWVLAGARGAPAPSVPRYLRRRALRILPGYWVALTVLAVFPGIAGPLGGDWWRYYLFLQLYDARTVGLGIPVAWTLCVEVSFYFALPLWAARLRSGAAGGRWVRRELTALGVLALAGAAVQIAAGRQAVPDLAAQALPGSATWFALGMMLAVLSVAESEDVPRWPRRLRRLSERPGWCWLGALAAFGGLLALRDGPGGLLGVLASLSQVQPYARLVAQIALTAVLVLLVVIPALGHRPRALPSRVLGSPGPAALGVISYGVFLWHLTIAEWLALPAMPSAFGAGGLDLTARVGDGATVLLFAATLALSCVVAAASYRWVELPFLRRKEG